MTGIDEAQIRVWYAAYVGAFTACGRGDSDELRTLLNYYGVPLLFAFDDRVAALVSEDDVLSAIRTQIDGLRRARYDRSEPLDTDTTIVNGTTAVHIAAFTRVRADGSRIAQVRATYLITGREEARRISAIAVQTL